MNYLTSIFSLIFGGNNVKKKTNNNSSSSSSLNTSYRRHLRPCTALVLDERGVFNGPVVSFACITDAARKFYGHCPKNILKGRVATIGNNMRRNEDRLRLAEQPQALHTRIPGAPLVVFIAPHRLESVFTKYEGKVLS